jgi:asparagine synthase (glutamine-hydrolysing)
MCSISGYYLPAEKNLSTQLHPFLEKATLAMTSRGPDATAYFFDNDHGIGFSHNRLKIQDLTDAGNQPFFSSDGRFVLVFNGQIYNHKELRTVLKKLGWKFESECDTETLLVAYQQWGEAALHKLEGMFAFAIYDFTEKTLLLVRDRFGIKPLYFYADRDLYLFASQLNALQILYNKPVHTSELSLYHYLHLLAVPAPLTMYKELFKLPAGFLLKVTNTETVIVKRWYEPLQHLNKSGLSKPNLFPASIGRHTAETTLSTLLENIAKKYATSSDVPVAIFLSGGVDSSLLAKLVSKYANLTAFHLRFEKAKDLGETLFARKIAQELRLPLFELVADEKMFLSAIDELLQNTDDLVADPVCISFWILAKFAKKHKFKVVLLGEGADELFWGYDLYKKHSQIDRLFNFLRMNALQGIKAELLKKIFSGYKLESLLRLVNGKDSFESGALGFFSQQLISLKEECLKNMAAFSEQIEMVLKFFQPNQKFFDALDITTWHTSARKKIIQNSDFWITYQETLHRLPELLLMRCDKVAMAHGLEARVPFLDHRLVEFALSLPKHIKLFTGQPKALLKSLAEKELGSKSVWNKKTGFSAPLLHYWKTHFTYSPLLPTPNKLSLLQKWCVFLTSQFRV